MNLTHDTSKVLASIYKTYLERRKHGLSISEASFFNLDFYKAEKSISDWQSSDISICLSELKNVGFVKIYASGNFLIERPLITFMENRFKSGLSEITKYIADLAAGVATSLIV